MNKYPTWQQIGNGLHVSEEEMDGTPDWQMFKGEDKRWYGGALPPYPYNGQDLLDKPVWYIEGKVEWVPDRRRKGRDRPTLTRHEATVVRQLENLLWLCLEDGTKRGINLCNWVEQRRIQDREG